MITVTSISEWFFIIKSSNVC